jgi:hypothetical protein
MDAGCQRALSPSRQIDDLAQFAMPREVPSSTAATGGGPATYSHAALLQT